MGNFGAAHARLLYTIADPTSDFDTLLNNQGDCVEFCWNRVSKNKRSGVSPSGMVNQTNKIRIFTALISFTLSTLAYYFDDLINNDGILYMYAAEAFLSGGWSAVSDVYPWPFFSVMVAWVHLLTGIPLEISACILNILFFVLLTDVLVRISAKLLPEGNKVFIAALLILCFFTLNEYRNFIVRDIGYWAFCCLALYQFILFLEKPTLMNFIYWQSAILVSILFRLDGLVIFLGLPVYLLLISSSKYTLGQSSKINYKFIFSLFLATTLVVGTVFITTSFDTVEIYNSYTSTGEEESLLALLNSKVSIIETQILNKYSADYSALVLISGLIVMMIYKLLKGVSIGYLVLYIASWFKHRRVEPNQYTNLLLYFITLNIFLLLTVLFHRYFVSQRHAIIVSVTILLLLLPRITGFIESAWRSKNNSWKVIIVAVLLISLVDGITQSNSKSYIKNTALWASDNLDNGVEVLTDDRTIEYYFNTQQPLSKLTREIDINSYQGYGYVIVVEKRNNTELKTRLKTMNINPIFDLKNRRGDKATVYKVMPKR